MKKSGLILMWIAGILLYLFASADTDPREHWRRILRGRPEMQTETAAPPSSFFEKQYSRFGPSIMLSVLEEEDPFCHTRSHALGRVIYAHTKNIFEAVSVCGNSCNTGCVHGALMGLLDTNQEFSAQRYALSKPAKERIVQLCKDIRITSRIGVGNCYHALGHMLVTLADYQLPAAIALCRLFEKSGDIAVYYCATGAYMERDIVLGISDISKNLLYPCKNFPYAVGCYRYKMQRLFKLPRQFAEAKVFCLTLSHSQRLGCFHGIGFGTFKMVLEDPGSLAVLCDQKNADDLQMCIEGAIDAVGFHDLLIAKDACSFLQEQETCLQALKHVNFGMERNARLYTLDK